MNDTFLMPLMALSLGGCVVSFLFIGGLIPGTFGYLSRQVRALNKQERLSAVHGLGRLGDTKATLLLCSMINHHELDMRRAAVDSLAMTASPLAVDPLGTMLSDSNPLIRRAAAMGLAAFDDPRATAYLNQALKDIDEQVVTTAIMALAHRRDPAAIEPLCRALVGSPEVARAVSKALVIFGMDAFETLCRLLPEAGAVTGERMIEVLRAISPEASVQPLMHTLSNARVEATVNASIRALTALNPPGLLELLCRIVLDPQALGRGNAIAALREIDQPEGISAIAQVLGDPNPEFRRAAVLSLAGHSEPLVVDALCRAFEDPDPDVVRYAAQALGTLRDRRILRSFFIALYPQDGDSVVRILEEALKRSIDDLESAQDFLPVLERWAGPSARQDDQTARYSMQSALILFNGRIVKGFRDLTSTLLVFKGQEWSSVTREDRLHPLAASSLEFISSPREVRQFQASRPPSLTS